MILTSLIFAHFVRKATLKKISVRKDQTAQEKINHWRMTESCVVNFHLIPKR